MPSFDVIRPRLARSVAQGVADQAGGVAYGGAVEGDVSTIAFGGPTADFILYGVVNGAFAQGPPDPNDYIDPQINPMPYWSGPTQVSGGAIQVMQVADASSPSGYNLRFTVNPGAASDEAYVEQIIPIGGSRARWIGARARASYVRVSGVNNTAYVNTQYLTAAGIVTGSSTEQASTSGNTLAVTANASVGALGPGDAAYLRIRIGVRSVLGTASIIDFADVRIDAGHPYVLVPDDSGFAWGPGIIQQSGGLLTVGPNGNSGTKLTVTTSQVAVSGGTFSAPATMQTVRADSGSIAAGSSADVTLTWPTAFADTNYSVAISVGYNDATSRAQPTGYHRLEAKTAALTKVRVINNAAVSETVYVEAVAIHD